MIVRELLAKFGFEVDDKTLSRWMAAIDAAKGHAAQAAQGAQRLRDGLKSVGKEAQRLAPRLSVDWVTCQRL